MSNFEETNSEVWHVQVAEGDVRVMTLDELDEAFQDGWIDESTFVLKEGTTTWSTLADIAGIDDAEQAPPPPAAPAPQSAVPMHVRAAAPVIVARSAFVEPPPATNVTPYTMPAQPLSMRPVVSEISDFELEPQNFRSSRRGLKIAIGALLVLGGAAFGVTRFAPATVAQLTGQLTGSSPVPVVAAPAPVELPAAPAAMNANVTASITNAAAPAPIDTANATSSARLSDEQRRALIDADKARESKRKARTPAPSPRHSKGSKRPTGPAPFNTNGAAGDPLNAKL